MKEEPRGNRFSFEIHNKVPPGGLDTFKIELNRQIIAADALNLLKDFDDISKCSKCWLIGWKLSPRSSSCRWKKMAPNSNFVERQNVAIRTECALKGKVNIFFFFGGIFCGTWHENDPNVENLLPAGSRLGLRRCFGQMSISADPAGRQSLRVL